MAPVLRRYRGEVWEVEAMAIEIRSMKFWINAFIPRDIPGYTMTVPKGRYAGLTMIPGPQTVGIPIPPRPFPYMMHKVCTRCVLESLIVT